MPTTAGDFVATSFSPDGTKIYAVSGNQVTVINTATGATITTYTFGNQLGAIDVSPDGRYVAVVEEQPTGGVGSIYRIDLANGNIGLFTVSGASALYDVAYLADGRIIVSQQVTAPLRVVNLDTGDSFSPTIDVPASATLNVSADGTYVTAQPGSIFWPIYAYDSETGTGYLWNGNPDPYAGASLPPADSGVGAVSPDGSLVVQGMTLRVYDGTYVSSFSLSEMHPYLANPSGLAFSPSGDQLYVLDEGGNLAVLDTATWEAIGIYSIGDQVPSPNMDLSVRFGDLLHASEDGKYVSVIGNDGVHVIDLTTADFQSTQGDDVISGTGRLIGLGGNDVLTAIGDAAQLWGGQGDDTYFVSSENHRINELPGEGHDTVHSTVTYGLAWNFSANAEDLILDGSESIDGYGTNEDNLLVGNEAANILSGFFGNDELHGGGGDDTLEGGGGKDFLDGGAGRDTASYENTPNPLEGVVVSLATAGPQLIAADDTDTLVAIENLKGSFGSDRLTGNAQANVILGWFGDDVINGGAGIDLLDGQDGSDIYLVSFASDHSAAEFADSGTSGSDEVRFSATSSAQTLLLRSGDTGIERVVIGTGLGPTAVTTGLLALNVDARAVLNGLQITGNSGANTIHATAFADSLSGGNGDDRFYGYAGDDTLDGGRGADIMYGGDGSDTYYVDDASDAPIEYDGITGGIDQVFASVSHTLKASVENLTLTGVYSINGTGNASANVIVGNSGSNLIRGMDGNDNLVGNNGNDRLEGGAGADTLSGGAGSDWLDGGTGNDLLYGGIGNDTYVVNSAGDIVIEEVSGGTDKVQSSISFTLDDLLERLELTGTADIDGVGNDEINVLTGNAGNNALTAGAGADKVYAGAGNDVIDGGTGNDWLEGGSGLDQVTGGSGSDRFVFRTGDFGGSTTVTADIIHDFSHAEADKIRLDLVDANTTLAGTQDFAFLGAGSFTGIAGQLRYEQISGNTYVSGDTNGDGIADFMIRLDGLHTLVSGDFIL